MVTMSVLVTDTQAYCRCFGMFISSSRVVDGEECVNSVKSQ